MKINNDKIYKIISYLIISAGCLLRLIAFLNHNNDVVGDECHSIVQSIGTMHYIFTSYMQGANFLPGYTLILKTLSNILSYSWTVVKIPSLITALLSLFIFKNVINRIFTSKIASLFALILFSFSYSLIVYSAKIKPYSIDVLCSCLLLSTFLYLNENKENIPIKKFIIYTIFAMIMVYTSIPAIPLLAVFIFLLLIKQICDKNKKNIIGIIISSLFILITVVIEYFTYIIQMKNDSGLYQQWFDNGEFLYSSSSLAYINDLIHNSFLFTGGSSVHMYYHLNPIALIFCIIIFFIGTIILLKSVFQNVDISDKLKGFYIIIPVYLFLILSALKIYPVADRAGLFLVPFFAVILTKSFDLNSNKIIKIVSVTLCFICFILYIVYYWNIGTIKQFIFNNNQSNEIKKHTAFIIEQSKRDDVKLLSFDGLCSKCINIQNYVSLYDAYNENSQMYVEYYNGRINQNEEREKAKLDDLLEDKPYVLYLVMGDLFIETNSRINDVFINGLLEHGYTRILRKDVFCFMSYELYKKDTTP